MEDQKILLSQKEKEIIKSCFYMAMKEGLYHFDRIDLDAGEEEDIPEDSKDTIEIGEFLSHLLKSLEDAFLEAHVQSQEIGRAHV